VANSNSGAPSRAAVIAGWIIGILPALMMVFSGAMKFMMSPEVQDSFKHLGWPVEKANTLGILELACTAIYFFPRTAILGAILLTGYLGGATATHVRIGDPWFFPVVIGILFWLSLYLRDMRVREVLPLR